MRRLSLITAHAKLPHGALVDVAKNTINPLQMHGYQCTAKGIHPTAVLSRQYYGGISPDHTRRPAGVEGGRQGFQCGSSAAA